MSRRLLLILAATLVPAKAAACTWCVSSAFGDRTFNWPYLSLIVAPFIVAAAVAGVLVHAHVGFGVLGRRLASVAAARLPRFGAPPRSPGGAAASASAVATRLAPPPIQKETT